MPEYLTMREKRGKRGKHKGRRVRRIKKGKEQEIWVIEYHGQWQVMLFQGRI